MQQVGGSGVTNGQHPHYLSVAPPEEKKEGMRPPLSLRMSILGQASLYSFCLAVPFTELCGSVVNYAVMEKQTIHYL